MKKLIFTTALLIASSLTVNAQLKLTMKLSAYDLASFNESTQCWETASGKYTFKFGAMLRTFVPMLQSTFLALQRYNVMMS